MTPETVLPGRVVYDDLVTGLHLRVSLLGRRHWYLRYRTRAKIERRPKLGTYPTMTLETARSVARNLLAQVTLGEDPMARWRASRDEITVAELFSRCWNSYWVNPRYQRSGWANEVEGYYRRRIAGPFGKLKVSEMTPGRIREWHEGMADTPTEGNRSLEVLSRLFTFAEERDLRPVGSNPCRRVQGFAERKRTRYATPDEIRRIAVLLEKRKDRPREVAFIYLLMLTGARPQSIAEARRDQLRGNVLTFRGKSTAKTGVWDSITLPDYAMTEIIAHLPKRSDGLLVGGPIPQRFWDEIRREAGCPDLWARDWRRTYATLGLSSGVALDVIGQLLNHKTTQTTLTYASLMPHAREVAANKIAAEIQALL